ncbi:MAG TPA: OpgC domain-containing protein [Candidatus Acidoferrum sp.]|nr:OpgC domain-containing protein [Candidatus Acidoferrum sp.]
MGRRLEIDAVRGLMLVWMALTHLPTFLPNYTNQPFGFVSASEGFIFLSALFTGRIYFRLAESEGYPAMGRKLLLRTLRLYAYHALLLVFAFLVAVPIAARGNRPQLYNLLDYYFAVGPRHAVTEAFLLIYRPPLLDILPMYILFLLLTAIVLTIARRVRWTPILAGSTTVWFLAHLGVREAEHDFVNRVLRVHIPINEMGSFDLWAWQFLWILGLWFGVRWAQGNLPVEKWARAAVIPAAIVFAVLLPLRYAVGRGIELGAFEPMFDKWHFGVVRLIDFAAAAALLIRFQQILKPLAVRPLVLLGQSSLQVFCVHLLFTFAGLTLLGNAAMLKAWQQVSLLVATLAAMLLTAKIFARSEAKVERKVDASPTFPQLQASDIAALPVATAKSSSAPPAHMDPSLQYSNPK